jgi:hypothetical protein
MKRSGIIWFGVVLHSLAALAYVVGASALWRVATDPDVFPNNGGFTVLVGFKVGAGLCLLFAALSLLITFGLWKRKGWVRWLGIGMYVLPVIWAAAAAVSQRHPADEFVDLIFLGAMVMYFVSPSLKIELKRPGA